MKISLSLEQELRELRAAHKLKGQKKANRSDPTRDLQQSERPWQADIERVQQTMREVLRAMASFSGVELPGLPPGFQDDGVPLPRFDIKTLKDRFRNDLEGFSLKTTEELSKQAKEQTHAALDAIQNEIGGRIEQVAAELREQLQAPAQVERVLETSFNEAEARLESSLYQKIEQLVAERERLAQEKLPEVTSPIQAQTNTPEEAATKLERSLTQKVEQLFAERERLAQEKLPEVTSPIQAQTNTPEEAATKLERSLTQKVEQLFAERERLAQAKLQEALVPVQAQTNAVEEAATKLERSLTQKVEQLFAEREQLAQVRLQEALVPVQAQTNAIEEAAARLETSLSQKVEQLFAEREQLAQVRLQEALVPVQAQTNAIEEAAARLETSLSQKVEQLFAEREQLAQAKLQEVLGSVQAQISTLEQTVHQILDLKADSVAQLSAERPKEATDNEMKKYESGPSNELNTFLNQAFSRIERSVNNFIVAPKMQFAQSTFANVEEHPKTIPFVDADMDIRVQQALEHLGQLGSKNPHAASKVENLKATP